MTATSEILSDPEELGHRHDEDYSEVRLAWCARAEASYRQIRTQFERL